MSSPYSLLARLSCSSDCLIKAVRTSFNDSTASVATGTSAQTTNSIRIRRATLLRAKVVGVPIARSEVGAQADEVAVAPPNDIVLAHLGRQRWHAAAVLAHAVQVVVGIDRHQRL